MAAGGEAADVDHGLWGPPALALVAEGFDDGVAVDESGACADAGPCAGFAEVIDAGPEELSGIGGVVTEREPNGGVTVIFGAHDFVIGMGGVSIEEITFMVIDADDIHEVRVSAGEDVVLDGLEDGHGDGAGGIELMGEVTHVGELFFALSAGEVVVDFISERPDDHAGMVAVAAESISEVGAPPVTEVGAVVLILILADGPDFDEFLHHEHALAVADVEEMGGGGIVGGADGVDAEGFEDGDAAFPDAVGNGDAEGTAFAVEGGAEEFEVFAVEPEAGVGFEFELAYAEGNGLGVDGFAVGEDVEGGVVKVGRIEIPDGGVGESVGVGDVEGFAGGDDLRGGGFGFVFGE